jgi:carbamoyl-phosphate synthase large subunit
MKRMHRILVTGAGGAPGVNFIQSLREAPEPFFIIGTDINRYHLQWPNVDGRYLVPRCTDSGYVDVLNDIIRREEINFIHGQPDVEVAALSENRDRIRAKNWLPSVQTVRILQDKLYSGRVWENAGLHRHETIVVQSREDVERAGDVLGFPFWLRASTGAGGRGSTPVESVDAGAHWLAYWQGRGVDWTFIAQEYLPGADFAFQSIWKDGALLTSQARERTEYIFPHLAASERTGTPIVAVTVHRDDVNQIATKAVRAIDQKATGIFCVDLREDRQGIPRPTEINCGRFFTTSLFFSRAGANMPYQYVKLGLGEDPGPMTTYNAVPAGLCWIRHVDCPAVLANFKDLDAITCHKPL